MTQVSQIFGLDNPGDIHVDNLSAADESDEENRDDEIKKLLEEGLSNETFDYDSDISSHNGSKFSNHNDCSFVSNKESQIAGDGDVEDSLHFHGGDSGGLFQTPKGHDGKHVDFLMIPNIIPSNSNEEAHNRFSPAGQNGFKTNGNGIHINGNPEAMHDNVLPALRSNTNGNGMEQNQKNCEKEEIEITNPTISLLHKDHCPQTEHDGLAGTGIWLSADTSVEKLKTVAEFRERQIQRAESTIATLQKDKRALNHQIGLMKTEMVHIKSQQDEAEKFAQLKDEEVNYLKTKIQEAIEEYDHARQSEAAAKEDNNELLHEVDKLRQEVKLLSSLGASTQQAELNDVVRQLREKHAKDIASWQKVVVEYEGQIRTYKRTQQILHEDSVLVTKESVQTQTEYCLDEEVERRERELAAQEFQEEFGLGGCDDAFLNSLKNLPEPEIVKRVRAEWKTERDKLVKHYMREIKIYRNKLASLPAELYEMWEKTQEELGLNKRIPKKRIRINASSMTDKCPSPEKCDQSTSFNLSMRAEDCVDTEMRSKTFQEASVQVNSAAVLANAVTEDENIENKATTENGSINNNATSSSHAEEKETSSVICQTEETLETYKILASLIDSWAQEVSSSKDRAETAENRSKIVEDELKVLYKKFKHLQKMAVICRKEWKKQEEALKTRNGDLTAKYVGMLKKLNEKLELVDEQ